MMIGAKRVLSGLFLAICLAMLSGCGTPAVKVGVSSTANLNMNADNQPLPVVVRIYQLSDSQAFENASFDDLWKHDLVTLGDSLVMREEITMDPAFQKRITMPRHDQAKYIAAMAVFRDPGEDGWKAMRELPNSYLMKKFSTSVKVSLKGNTLSINE